MLVLLVLLVLALLVLLVLALLVLAFLVLGVPFLVLGVPFLAETYRPPWGGGRFFCVDPDGYLVEIEQPA